jgi:DNA-binding GntR family transcriptional regulator
VAWAWLIVHTQIAFSRIRVRRNTFAKTESLAIPEHMALLDALRRKDPEAAEKAMRMHIRRSVEKLLRDAEAEDTKE